MVVDCRWGVVGSMMTEDGCSMPGLSETEWRLNRAPTEEKKEEDVERVTAGRKLVFL